MKKTLTGKFYRMSYVARKIAQDSTTATLILILCTVISLLLSNLSFSQETYPALWTSELLFLRNLHLPYTSKLIINDLIMPFFFFSIGYEIRHELFSTTGSINSPKKATLPLVTAIGGILMPAILFSFINKGTPFQHGWAIPTATDIAFSLAVVAMLSKHIPNSVKVLLMALAVFDDLIAIFIIALFYGSSIKWLFLVATVVISYCGYILHTRQKRYRIHQVFFIVVYVLLWYAIHLAGIHATISGIIIAFIMPRAIAKKNFYALIRWVEFLILPLFVLSNTAIAVNVEASEQLFSSLSIGIFVGLVFGKPLGITLTAIIGQRLHIATLPKDLNIMHVFGIGLIAGIGFTMSIFIANLSFSDVFSIDIAKLSIIFSSTIAAVMGILFFRLLKYSRRNIQE